jgi:hypothetical protein
VESNFRSLTGHEREVLERLLEPRFPGRDELRVQLAIATARTVDEHGCIELRCESAPPAPVKHPIPTQGDYRDADGSLFEVLLWAPAGHMTSLEIIWYGDAIPRGLPPAGDLSLFAPYSDEAGVWNRSPKFP